MQSGTYQLNAHFFPTTNTKLAASLATVGFTFFKGLPASLHYDGEAHPINQVPRNHPDWKKGIETWYFEHKGDFMGLNIAQLSKEFDERKADVELDQVFAELEKVLLTTDVGGIDCTQEEIAEAGKEGCRPRHIRIKNLVKKLKDVLPFALMAYMSHVLENRERMTEAIKKNAEEMVVVPRGEGCTIIKRSTSDATKKKLLGLT